MKNKESFTQSFRQAQLNFTSLYAQLLTEEDLSLQQFALLNLLNNAGSVAMTQASLALNVTKPAVTNLVDRLEKMKYVKRTAHPEDRRSFLLEIQPKGAKSVERIQEIVFGLLFKTLGKFKESDQDAVHAFYRELCLTMERRLKQHEGSPVA